MKIRFRIAAFLIPEEKTGNTHFVEVGKPYREKIFWIFYKTKTNWVVDAGFRSNDDAVQRIDELKKALPVYTEIL